MFYKPFGALLAAYPHFLIDDTAWPTVLLGYANHSFKLDEQSVWAVWPAYAASPEEEISVGAGEAARTIGAGLAGERTLFADVNRGDQERP